MLLTITASDLWKALFETFEMVAISGIISTILGVVLGLLLNALSPKGVLKNKYVYAVINVIVNIVRSVPYLILGVLLIPFTMVITGIFGRPTFFGALASCVSLSIASTAFIAKVVEGAASEVSPSMIEAGVSLGLSKFQIVTKIILKEALPSIVNGISLALVSLLGISAVVVAWNGGGLGSLAKLVGIDDGDRAGMLLIVAIIIVIVLLIQFIGSFLYKKIKYGRGFKISYFAVPLAVASILVCIFCNIDYGKTGGNGISNQHLTIETADASNVATSAKNGAADLGICSYTFADNAGFDVRTDCVVQESLDMKKTNVNILVVRKEDENKRWVKILSELITSEDSEEFINDYFQGAMLPLFQDNIAALPNAGTEADDKTVIRIGGMINPSKPVIENIKSKFESYGYTLEIEVFSEFALGNPALYSKTVDATLFQHTPYLNSYLSGNKDASFTIAAEVYYPLFGGYSTTIKNVSELTNNSVIAIPNDISNGVRALKVLIAAGIIELDIPADLSNVGMKDLIKNITYINLDANKKYASDNNHLTIETADASNVATSAKNGAADLGICSYTFADNAGFDVRTDCVVQESLDMKKTNVNILVVRKEDENKRWVKILSELITSEASEKFIDDYFAGAMLPLTLDNIAALPNAGTEADDKKVIRIGGMINPSKPVIENIKEKFESYGYTLEIEVFTEFALGNPALYNKTVDATLFQHTPYLNAYLSGNKDASFTIAAEVYYPLFGGYSTTITNVRELTNNSVIAIPNDISNGVRALKVLIAAGVIELDIPDDLTNVSLNDLLKQIKYIDLDNYYIK